MLTYIDPQYYYIIILYYIILYYIVLYYTIVERGRQALSKSQAPLTCDERSSRPGRACRRAAAREAAIIILYYIILYHIISYS